MKIHSVITKLAGCHGRKSGSASSGLQCFACLRARLHSIFIRTEILNSDYEVDYQLASMKSKDLSSWVLSDIT